MQEFLIKQNTFASFIPFKICIFRSPTILFIDSIGSIVCAYRFEVKPIIATIESIPNTIRPNSTDFHRHCKRKLLSTFSLYETAAHRLIMVIASLEFKTIRCLPHRSHITYIQMHIQQNKDHCIEDMLRMQSMSYAMFE